MMCVFKTTEICVCLKATTSTGEGRVKMFLLVFVFVCTVSKISNKPLYKSKGNS